MNLTVNNSDPQHPLVTLFGELRNSLFVAEVMPETAVPYAPYWEGEVDQVVVYITPDENQLAAILAALNARRLAFSSLQEYGGAGGGTSSIPV